MYTMEERLEWREYVTARISRVTPIYDWYTFPHSYSRDLVHEVIDEFQVGALDVVFDPFVGAGTTLLACREKGIRAFGLDQLPFSVFVTNSKLRNYDVDVLQQSLDRFSVDDSTRTAFGDIPTVDRAFCKAANARVSAIYRWILSLPEKQASFFLLGLMYLLEDVSRAKKSGGWLRLVDNEVDPETIESRFVSRAEKMLADLAQAELPYNNGMWGAFPGDARLNPRSVRRADCIITSPPYLNRHDYTRVFALEMALHFTDRNQDLIDYRHTSFRSHVEARPLRECAPQGYVIPDALATALSSLRPNLKKHDVSRIPRMITGYFEDMHATLDALWNRLNPGGHVAFVLGNVRFAGVMIPVDEVVAEIGEQVGLVVDKIVVARYRGNSAQQMAEYGRQPSRESMILWHKE